jgi:hypothetical protein
MQEEAEVGQSPWRLPFGWLGLLALAWLIIELTHQPALGAIAVCLKFGWEDFLTARWLWRSDPDPWRRRSTFWLYLAWGLWKTAVVAFLMCIGFATVARRNQWLGPVPPGLAEFIGTLTTMLAGFALSTVLTVLAFFCAWCGGVRLWLDSAVHRARRLDCWPPAALCRGRTNRLGHLLITTGVLGFLAMLLTLVVGVAPFVPVKLFVILLTGFMLLLGPVTLLLFRDVISRKLGADSPYDCWHQWEEDAEEAWQEEALS